MILPASLRKALCVNECIIGQHPADVMHGLRSRDVTLSRGDVKPAMASTLSYGTPGPLTYTPPKVFREPVSPYLIW